MILTITLNPAVDRTVEVSNFEIDKVNRATSIRRDIGGKGLNVTKTIESMGGESKALLVLGGKNGDFIKEKSLKDGLNILCFDVLGNTRENIKIVDPVANTYTDINETGPEIDENQANALLKLIKDNVRPGDWMVISGSTPRGIENRFYSEIFRYAHEMDIKIIADVNGQQLKDLLQYKPHLIKPNIDELSDLVGKKIKTRQEVISYAKKILENGIEVVVVSLGEDGLLWVTEKDVYSANALKVRVLSTVGAGDAIVAGITWSLDQRFSVEDTIKNAVAAATCVITNEGTEPGDFKEFEHYKNQIFVSKIELG